MHVTIQRKACGLFWGDPVFPWGWRISGKGGVPIRYFVQFSPKTAWKWKKFNTGGGGGWFLDPPVIHANGGTSAELVSNNRVCYLDFAC